MFKVAIFDMDGVIVDTEPLHYKAYHLMFNEVGIQVPPELYESFTGQSTLNICKQIVDYFGLDMMPDQLVRLKRRHFIKLFKIPIIFRAYYLYTHWMKKRVEA